MKKGKFMLRELFGKFVKRNYSNASDFLQDCFKNPNTIYAQIAFQHFKMKDIKNIFNDKEVENG